MCRETLKHLILRKSSHNPHFLMFICLGSGGICMALRGANGTEDRL